MKTSAIFLLVGSVNALIFPGSNSATRSRLKDDLLKICADSKRGTTATTEQQLEISKLFNNLEKLNPTKKPLRSPEVNGVWSLEYSTSDSIIGRGGFPRIGPILQTIDTTTLSAENSETVSYFGLKVPRKVTAELDVQTDKLTNVQFKKFSIGPLDFAAPKSFRGFLDVTYLDNDLRLTRGDKGNIFVLTRYNSK